MPNQPTTVAGPRGTGRPNLLLQADFAGVSGGMTPKWVLIVETTIPIDDNTELAEVTKLLASNDSHDIERLANLLIDNVPKDKSSEPDQKKAKHLIAAAFDLEYPGAQRRPLTKP